MSAAPVRPFADAALENVVWQRAETAANCHHSRKGLLWSKYVSLVACDPDRWCAISSQTV